MIRTGERGDGQEAGRALADRRGAQSAKPPDLRLSSPASVLHLQNAAGNRAVGLLQRRTKDWIRTHSIADFTIDQWTADERREQLGALVAGLEEHDVDATDRETMELNLETFEAWGAAHGVELAEAQAFRLRQVARAAAVDTKALAAAAKEMLPDDFDAAGRFRGNVEWAVDQLGWATDRLGEAIGNAQTRDPAKLKTAGRQLTLAISVIKAMAAYLGYVQVAIQVETEAPHSWGDEMATKIAAFSDAIAPPIWKIRNLDANSADQAAAELLQEVPTWRFDFSQFVDRMQENLEKRARFLKILTIIQLAWLAFDIWTLPVTGAPGGGGAPRITGPPGGAIAISGGGVLISAESIEAIRALIRAGVLANPQLIKIVGGSAPPKPLQASPPKAPDPPSPAGGAGGGRARPAPTARPAKGLPTLEEDAAIQEYTRDLAEFRERRRALDDAKATRPRDAEAIKNAAKAEEAVRRRLDAIEARAAADKGELAGHLDPLVRERDIMKRTGMKGTATGTRVSCEAVNKLPSDLRYTDFADLPKLGTPKTVDTAAKPGGAGLPAAHQRITWEFADKSRIVIDVPRKLGGRAASADLPHIEFHGPKGERLDPRGFQIPEGSIGAHVTITDYGNLLERTFLGPARAGH